MHPWLVSPLDPFGSLTILFPILDVLMDIFVIIVKFHLLSILLGLGDVEDPHGFRDNTRVEEAVDHDLVIMGVQILDVSVH